MNSGRSFATLATVALALCAATPALAQDSEADLDALVSQSETPKGALALAHKQAEAGELLEASATLERALLLNSEGRTAKVRLYYAAILCRLDDKLTARSELAKLDGLDISDAGWAEVQAACGSDMVRPPIGPGRKREGFRGEVTAGFAYDSDLAGSLLVQFNLPGGTPNDDGLSFVGSARLDGRLPVGGGYVYGGASGVTKNNVDGPNLDFQVVDGRLGFGKQGDGFEFSAGGVLRHGRISASPFLTEYGAEAEVALALGGDSRIAVRGELVHQDYMNSTAAFSRDGTRIDIGAQLQGRSGVGTNYWLGAAYEDKSSETARTGYAGFRGFGALRHVLTPAGTYGSLFAMARKVSYVDQAGFVPVDETRIYGRAALGIPLTLGLSLEGAGSYTWRGYNAASGFADYDNWGAELRLVWTFGH